MSIIVLDAGALIALERNSRHIWPMVEAAYDRGERAQVPVCVLALALVAGRRLARSAGTRPAAAFMVSGSPRGGCGARALWRLPGWAGQGPEVGGMRWRRLSGLAGQGDR